MSAAGPELPPHLLAKRKRQAEEEAAASSKESTKASPQHDSRSSSPEAREKRRKIAGPAAPPAPLDQRPAGPPNDNASDSDSSDDDFGPAMPSTSGPQTSVFDNISLDETSRSNKEGGTQRLQRDDWMMAPPSHDDALSRIDPTKMRARKFNTGRAGGAPADHREMGAAWFETPEEKRKRLENEMLGVSNTTATSTKSSASGGSSKSKSRDEETARRVKEHNEKNRGKSLYDSHQTSSGKVEEDDPSARAFDREKDVGGVKIGNAQRKELLQKAANGFSSKFSGGGYL